jgi:CheY-like chemotaxis protein
MTNQLKVLVVDNNAFARAQVKAMLAGLEGLEVHETADAAAGLEDLRHWDPHLVVVDYAMHPTNGLDFTRRVRSGLRTPQPDVPILLMTGHRDLEHMAVAQAAGVDAVLAKPFSAEGLIREIQGLLVRRAQRREAEPDEGRLAG